jgi:hypothetical protein
VVIIGAAHLQGMRHLLNAGVIGSTVLKSLMEVLHEREGVQNAKKSFRKSYKNITAAPSSILPLRHSFITTTEQQTIIKCMR